MQAQGGSEKVLGPTLGVEAFVERWHCPCQLSYNEVLFGVNCKNDPSRKSVCDSTVAWFKQCSGSQHIIGTETSFWS